MVVPNYSISSSTPYFWSRYYVVPNHPGNGVDVPNSEQLPQLVSSKSQVTSSITTPGFATLKKRGKLLPENPYGKTVEEFKAPVGTYSRLLSFGRKNSDGEYVVIRDLYSSINAITMGCISNFSDVMPQSDAYRKANAKVMEKATLAKSQLAVSVLELGKTGTMIASSATRIYKSVKALKRGRLGDFTAALGISIPKKQTTIWLRDFTKYKRGSLHESEFRFSKVPRGRFVKQFRQQGVVHVNNMDDFMAKSWLEYAYGWLPLLQDIHGSMEALASTIVKNEYHLTTVSGVGSDEWKRDLDYKNSDETLNYNVKETWKHSIRIVIRFRMPDSVKPSIAFGFNNPALVAWELVPFSFVVDWFLPIGDYLESFTAFDGLTFLGGAISSKTSHSLESSVWAGKPELTVTVDGPQTLTPEPFKLGLTRTSFAFTRQKMEVWPSYGRLKFKSPVSIRHAITSVALLQSLFIKKAR